MTTRWVVERFNVVRYLSLRKLASSVDLFLDAFLFEAAKERFRDRVDAPMSNFARGVRQVRQDQGVQFTNNIPLKAAMDLFGRKAFGRASRHVSTGPRFAAHTNEGYCPQCVIGAAVSAPIEAMTISFPRRRL
jgi:hypothetical protein